MFDQFKNFKFEVLKHLEKETYSVVRVTFEYEDVCFSVDVKKYKDGKIQLIRNTRSHRKKLWEWEKTCPFCQTQSIQNYEETCFMDKELIHELKRQIPNHPKTRLRFMIL